MKRFLAVILVAIMLITGIPVSLIASAASGEGAISAPELTDASLSLGADLTMKFYVTVDERDEFSEGELRLKVTMCGKTVEITDYTVDGGKLVFAFEGIAPQLMTELIDIELYRGDTKIDETLDYSVKQNVQTLLTSYPNDTNLVRLLSDMLRYGEAAQKYRGYNIGNLATAGVTGMSAELADVPTSTDKKILSESAVNNEFFTSVGVRFDSVNKLYVTLSSYENTKIIVKIGDTVVATYDNISSTTVYTGAIYASNFGTVYTFELYDNDVLVQTLTYSVNSYCYSKKSSENDNTVELVNALYRYGLAAANYIDNLPEPEPEPDPDTPNYDGILNEKPPKTLKILAIGNSFSTDSMQYLYQICKNGGVENIVLGNLYNGGCSLDEHYDYAVNNTTDYTYYKNTTGAWETNKKYTLKDAVKDEDWDYISLQQTSKTCGLPNSYSKLDGLIKIVRGYNKTAKLIWNMTWAYQQDSTHSSFPKYDNDQMKMYTMTVDTVKECILSRTDFDLVIPCATSIQNARTSFMGDTLTRDGYHLDLNIGRYIAGLTWYAAITNSSVDNIIYNPNTSLITTEMLAATREAVKNSIWRPYEVTESTYKTGSRPTGSETIDPSVILDPADFIVADTSVAAGFGVDLSKYNQLEWSYAENEYWDTNTAEIVAAGGKNIRSKVKYSVWKTTGKIPVGSIFIIDSGWQMRPILFKEDGTVVGKSFITTNYFVLTEEYLDGATQMVWNVATNPRAKISSYQQASCHVRVYVPSVKKPSAYLKEDTALASQNNIDLRNYNLLSWEYKTNSYWHCTSKAGTTTPGSSAGTYQQNICSRAKYNISKLPVGTVFVLDEGWQYRLEIYEKENEKYTGTRPGFITQRIFVLTDDFLKGCQYVAWNISANPKKNISNLYLEAATHLRIYIPSTNAADYYKSDKELATEHGVDLSQYQLFEWNYTSNAYWNGTSSTSTIAADGKNICSTNLYSKTELPAGAIFIIDEGWQLRIEKFKSKTAKYTGTRPGFINTNFYVLTDKFLSDCGAIGWNVSTDPRGDISAMYKWAASHVRIYVPKS